jgi:Fe-S cluster biogenesis protein NfuA
VNPHLSSTPAAAGNGVPDGVGRIEELIAQLERTADPAAVAQARALVQAVLEFHGRALARLLGHLSAAGAANRALFDTLAGDDLVASLLLLHDLHPNDLDARVACALERVRPQLHSHGGDVELVGLEGGVVRLRMRGSCHGCPSSSITLRGLIETAIYNEAPDVAAIEVEGVIEAEGAKVPPLVTIGST